MKCDDRVMAYLNKCLRHELTALNQCWLHYRLLDSWGMKSLASKEHNAYLEEMQHANGLIARMIFLEGYPNLQTLDPLRIGRDLKEILECDLATELSACHLYREARDDCEKKKDYVSMSLFERLIKEEEDRIVFLEKQHKLLRNIGFKNYVLLQSASSDKQEA